MFRRSSHRQRNRGVGAGISGNNAYIGENPVTLYRPRTGLDNCEPGISVPIVASLKSLDKSIT